MIEAEILVRTLGACFELVGLILVLGGIYRLHRSFPGEVEPLPTDAAKAGATSLWSRLKSLWFRLIRRPRPPTPHSRGMSTSVTGSASLTAGGKVGPNPNFTQEEKVAWLLSMVDRLQDRDDALETRIEAEAIARSTAMNDQVEAMAEADEELRTMIRTLATGDLNRQWWGIMAFLIGLSLQAWSTEIARVL